MLYHSARGSVNYTIVGNPAITNGVASGFAGGSNLQGNYLKTQSLPDFTGNVEIVIKFKTDTWAYGVLSSWIVANYSCYISINARGKPSCFFSRTGTAGTSLAIDASEHSFAFTEGQDCYLKVTKTAAGTLTMYSSTDGNTYTQFATKTNTDYGTSTVLSYFRIGVNAGYNPAQAFNGSIDLNETYIKVEGQPWFGICPIEVKKHQIMGPVGYTVVGSPTIVDGIASNFSLSSYCLVNTQFAPGNYSWEEQICFKLDYPGERKNMGLINSTLSDYLFPKIAVATESSTRLVIQPCLSGNGTSWSIGQHGDIVSYDYSKKSWVKLTYSDGTYTLKLKQEGEDFRVVATYENKPVIYQSPSATSFSIGADIGASGNWKSFFIGSIYLNETYIKVNEKLWFWQPQETKRIVVNGVEVWTKPE